MSYDLALGRVHHDLMFVPTQKQPMTVVRYTIMPMEGADRVAQQVKITLLAFLGEWFLDIFFGVPYLEDIMIKNPRLTTVESILRTKIMDVPDVLRITFFQMDFDRARRTLRVDFHCDTLLGVIKDSVILNTMMRKV
jgi:hypothetical protein